MKTIRSILICALAVGASACDGIFGSDDDNFTFSAQQTVFTEGMVNEANVNELVRTIEIEGIFLLPHPCHNMRGSMRRNQGGVVEVTIIASAENPNCPAEVSAMQYRLQTLGFARGFYRVSVFHEISGQPRQLIIQENVSIE